MQKDTVELDGKEVNALVYGIKTLQEAAEYEHKDVDILMHLLRTASFAKKFLKPSQLAVIDPNSYVELVRLSTVLTKVRNSSLMSRAITYNQLKALKPKKLLPLLLKYGDFPLATMIIELLGIDKLHVVYEEWCVKML